MSQQEQLGIIEAAIVALIIVENNVPELKNMKMDFSQAKDDLSLIGKIVKAS